MIKQIVFAWNFLYHDATFSATYHKWVIDGFLSLIEETTHLKVLELCKLRNKRGEQFSRAYFYQLSGCTTPSESYFDYYQVKLSQQSLDYLQSFINQETLVLGVELDYTVTAILSKLGITYINLWFHSWKLFDDTLLLFNTNNKLIFEKLQQYKVPEKRFFFYANYWRLCAQEQGKLRAVNDLLVDNSCLFVGQTLRDKSIDKDGVLLNILHFKDRIQQLSKQYTKIYYKPHPYAEENEEIESYLKDTPFIEKITNIPTYYLLMSEKIKKIVGISSSVIYEAKFFNKEIEYLYQPLFDIDADFSPRSFTSVYADYYNPMFWANILSPIIPTNYNVEDENYFYSLPNKLRNIKHVYYDYKYFDEIAVLSDKIHQLENRINNLQLINNNSGLDDRLLSKNSWLEEILSFRNSTNKKYKIITFLGLKIVLQK